MRLIPGMSVYRCHLPFTLYGVAEKTDSGIIVRRNDGKTESTAGWYPVTEEGAK